MAYINYHKYKSNSVIFVLYFRLVRLFACDCIPSIDVVCALVEVFIKFVKWFMWEYSAHVVFPFYKLGFIDFNDEISIKFVKWFAV